jgi:protoheme ferro-lyase
VKGRRAVLLMAYGGPASLDEVEPFLRDVRGGRETPPELVAEVRARYRAIGGGSPILERTREQAAALEERLNRPGAEGDAAWRVFVGMRHWRPFIRDAVAEIVAGGFDTLVALCLTPQESRMSVGAYFRALDDALPPDPSRSLRMTDGNVGAELVSARAESTPTRPGRRPFGSLRSLRAGLAPPLHPAAGSRSAAASGASRSHEPESRAEAGGSSSEALSSRRGSYPGEGLGTSLEATADLRPSAAPPTLVRIRSWHDHPGFVAAVAEKVVAALARFPAAERPGVQVIFTAHSLPEAILREGDPYDRQVRETAAAVAGAVETATGLLLGRVRAVEAATGLPLGRAGARTTGWHVAYQSAGARPEPWLGPSLDQVMSRLAGEGHHHLLVAPVGFVSDHVEVLYDLDVEARARARELGFRFERTESLNASPAFIDALATIVNEAVSSTSQR